MVGLVCHDEVRTRGGIEGVRMHGPGSARICEKTEDAWTGRRVVHMERSMIECTCRVLTCRKRSPVRNAVLACRQVSVPGAMCCDGSWQQGLTVQRQHGYQYSFKDDSLDVTTTSDYGGLTFLVRQAPRSTTLPCTPTFTLPRRPSTNSHNVLKSDMQREFSAEACCVRCMQP